MVEAGPARALRAPAVWARSVYGAMSPLVRRALHARLAAAATDEDVRARHLALCTDDPDADVGRAARGRRDPGP